MKILIAYYSRKGENYWAGSIKDLEKGNTQVVAEFIQEATGGDLFEIDSMEQYPADYHECTDVAKRELQENARPELTASVENMDEYDTVFLGYPNWWGTCPMAVFTFLDSYDFSRKRIIPFCTNEGSGMGGSERHLKKECPNATIERGFAVAGHKAREMRDKTIAWAKDALGKQQSKEPLQKASNEENRLGE